MLPRVHRLADSRPLGDWICDEFCIWDTEGIEPTRSQPPNLRRSSTLTTRPTVYIRLTNSPLGWICDEFCIWDTEGIEPARSQPPNLIRSSSLTTRPTVMWWEPSVPIVYTRSAEWLRSKTLWDLEVCSARFRFPPYLKCKIHQFARSRARVNVCVCVFVGVCVCGRCWLVTQDSERQISTGMTSVTRCNHDDHVKHYSMNEACHTYKRVIAPILSCQVTHINESCDTYGHGQ